MTDCYDHHTLDMRAKHISGKQQQFKLQTLAHNDITEPATTTTSNIRVRT